MAVALRLALASWWAVACCSGEILSAGCNSFEAVAQHQRQDLVAQILAIRQRRGSFSVIDIGGSMSSWSTPVADAVMDIFPGLSQAALQRLARKRRKEGNVSIFRGNINVPEHWSQLLKYVEIHGKFDLALTTHLLEDIRDPQLVASNLGKIARRGYVSVPSKYVELVRFAKGYETQEESRWHGFIHHRWVFVINRRRDRDNSEGTFRVTALAKLGFMEHEDYLKNYTDPHEQQRLDAVAAHACQTCFETWWTWKGSCEFETLNDDYIGPSADAVRQQYQSVIRPAKPDWLDVLLQTTLPTGQGDVPITLRTEPILQ